MVILLSLKQKCILISVLWSFICFISIIKLYNSDIAMPKKGKPIGSKFYNIDTTLLQSSRKNWAAASIPDSIHITANKLGNTFTQMTMDDELRLFLDNSANITSSRYGQFIQYSKEFIFHSLQRYLGWSRADASGFVHKADLYVASVNQFRQLLDYSVNNNVENGDSCYLSQYLLDIGSGRGTDTEKLASALNINPEQVTCVETSKSMRKVLENKGYTVTNSIPVTEGEADESQSSRPLFVSLLNVLDRCDNPKSLLESAISSLQPGGHLLLSIVLPFSSRVFEGKLFHPWKRARSRKPLFPLQLLSRLDIPNEKSFEVSAAKFFEAILRLQPQLELVQWTRLPYASSGDLKRTHYTLDMAVAVLKLNPHPPIDDKTSIVPVSGSDAFPLKCQNKGKSKIFAWLQKTLVENGYVKASWGRVLDAGAGINSMCWLLRQTYDTITEVTARPAGLDSYGDALHSFADDSVNVVVGNWKDEAFMKDTNQYDIVLSDYLLGSTELHWMYGAEMLLDRILAVLKPSGFLLIIGLEPYEMILHRSDPHDRLVLDVEAIGDSAALLIGESTYRELPQQWVIEQINRRPDFEVVATQQFQMKLTADSMRKQLSYATKTAAKIFDHDLRVAFEKRIEDLTLSLATFETHTKARNYAVVVQRKSKSENAS